MDILMSGNARRNDVVFCLNTFELDRETFKLVQERALLQLTESRLEPDYIENLVFAPLRAAVTLAESDINAAEAELDVFESLAAVGQETHTSVLLAQARLDDCKLILEKAKIELSQKQLDIEVMRRKFEAEKNDLEQRIVLNAKIRELHQFSMPFDGVIEVHSYEGSFLEEGDPICTVSMAPSSQALPESRNLNVTFGG